MEQVLQGGGEPPAFSLLSIKPAPVEEAPGHPRADLGGLWLCLFSLGSLISGKAHNGLVLIW